MAQVDIGKIKIVWKGAWNSSNAYTVDDAVSHSGSSYICIQAGTNQNPSTATAYWQVMASAGTNGTDVGATLANKEIAFKTNAGAVDGIPIGNAGEFLKVNSGATGYEYGAVSSNVDLVSYVALDATGVNTIDITTNWATNNYYKMEMFMQYQMSGNQGSQFRFRSSGGAVSNDSYQYLGESKYATQTHSNAVFDNPYDLNGNRTSTEINGWGFNSAEMNPHWNATIYKPDPNNRQFINYAYFNSDQSAPSHYHAYYNWHVWNNDTTTKTGWQVYGNSSTNFKTGFYVILGYKYQ